MGGDTRDVKVKVRVDNSGAFGLAWFMGWLFSIGFLHLTMPKAIFALVIWPYYIGKFLAR